MDVGVLHYARLPHHTVVSVGAGQKQNIGGGDRVENSEMNLSLACLDNLTK